MSEGPLSPAARFVSEPRSLGTLIVAEAEGDPPVLTAVGGLSLDPAGESRNPKQLPWLTAGSMPPFARFTAESAAEIASDAGAGQGPDAGSADAPSGSWLAALDGSGAGGSSRVLLWRDGTVEAIGEGDRFDAVDLACDRGRCALLTTRMGKVAAAGAEIWIGSPSLPATSWKCIEIIPEAGESSAHPLGLAQIADPGSTATPGVIAALAEKNACVFFHATEPGNAREIARFQAPYGILDAIAAPVPVAMTFGTPVDENGCSAPIPAPSPDEEADDEPPPTPAGPGSRIRFERAGASADLHVPSPPLRGSLRRLSQGSLALWIAPLGCGLSRHVVYGLVLDPTGAPAGSPIPIADAEHFAAASSGDHVDLWLQREQRITWVPMKCTPSPR